MQAGVMQIPSNGSELSSLLTATTINEIMNATASAPRMEHVTINVFSKLVLVFHPLLFLKIYEKFDLIAGKLGK